jgi:5-methylcytosine-specific restriction endonuclease McrA
MVDAIALWNKRYGKKESVKDYSGRKMLKAAYGDVNSSNGWNIDHIRPVSNGGSSLQCNLEICHIVTNQEKGDSFPAWNANEKRFQARKKQGKGCYSIEEIK